MEAVGHGFKYKLSSMNFVDLFRSKQLEYSNNLSQVCSEIDMREK